MKAEVKATRPKCPDWLSRREHCRLLALGKQLEFIHNKREGILTKAREIIGFEHAESANYFEEEMREVRERNEEISLLFVEYAQSNRRRWALEEAVDEIKTLMKELKMKPQDIQWKGPRDAREFQRVHRQPNNEPKKETHDEHDGR